MTTLGQKNKNPFCVKTPAGGPWKGQTGKDSKGHAIFENAAFGVRAAVRILSRYFLERGTKTLREVFAIYAPASDTVGSIAGAQSNDPGAYARFVSEAAGVGVDERLRLFDGLGVVIDRKRLIAILRAMARYESRWELESGVIAEGIDLYEVDFVEGKQTAKVDVVDTVDSVDRSTELRAMAARLRDEATRLEALAG